MAGLGVGLFIGVGGYIRFGMVIVNEFACWVLGYFSLIKFRTIIIRKLKIGSLVAKE